MSMPRIAHTSDIHIRSLSRHDEFRQAFEAFTKDCATSGVDHIFLGGDIFHTKTTGISGEYIDLLTWWLNDMTRVATVHIILGNHDGNLVNLTRQDAVSPIVDAMSNPKIKLYKKSGVYEFDPGYTFCVYSIFDEDGWVNVKPVPGKVNIACYHGPVWGSRTETDWDVSDGLKIDFFAPYQFTFLGDIHKRQDLAWRDGKPIMSYPGTLIQQNYAEDLRHGYLLWDIQGENNWTVTFREIENVRPYVTLDWMGDSAALIEASRIHPIGTRFRIRSKEQITQDEMHRLSESLKTARSASEVTYKSDQQIDKQSVTAGTKTMVKSDLRSPEVLVGLLRDFHGLEKMNDDEAATVTIQVKNYLSTACMGEEMSRGSKWSLRYLGWDNAFVYDENNVINFEKIGGIVGVFGPNRTGKSSIVGTLMYALYNATDRGPIKNIHVCNVRKPYCSARVVLTHDGTTYVVERQTTKSTNKKGIVTASTALNLFKIRDDGTAEDMCGEQRTDTEKTLRTLIGTSDDFLTTTLSAQGEGNHFISQGSTKRRQILSRFLDLDIFDKLYDVANKDFSTYKAQLKNYPDIDWSAVKTEHETSIKKIETHVSELTDKIASSQTKLSLLKSEMSSHDAKPVTQIDIDEQRRRVEDLTRDADDCFSSIETLQEELTALNSKIVTVDTLIKSSDIDDLKSRLVSQRTLEKAVVDLQHALDRETTLLKQQRKSLKILDEVPCGDEYPTCKFIKDAHSLKDKVEEQAAKVVSAETSLNTVTLSLEGIKEASIEDKIARHDKAVTLSGKLHLEASKKETELVRLRSSCETCAEELSDAKKKLSVLEEAFKNDENEDVVRLRTQIDEISQQIKDWDADRIETVGLLGKTRAKLERLNEDAAARDSLLDKMKLQELITTAFSKKGIPLVVAKTQLPLINEEVAKILHGIVDFTIELESDEESDALEIYIDYGDSRRIVELCSGMEKTIASIALRVAMSNVSSLPKPDVFVIDEGFGTLDNAGVEACNRLLMSLKNHFRTIVVITHVDGIKDVADHIIEITRHEKDSHVEFS